MIYEGLTKLNEKLETVPGAAEKWTYNADASELTFNLKPGLKYSDGSPLNAARFKYSIMRNINPETAGEYAQITDEIKGAPEWRSFADDPKKSKEDNAKAMAAAKAVVDTEGITIFKSDGKTACAAKLADAYKDADCTVLKLKFANPADFAVKELAGKPRPAPYFHTVMSLWVTYPAKEENITAGKDIWWTSSKYQIGNGPFILKSIEPYVKAVFTPNANYAGDKAKIDLEYSYITDGAVAFEAYKNNEFDVDRSRRRGLQERPGGRGPEGTGQGLPRLLHLRRDVPSVEGTVHRPEGAPGVCPVVRSRGVGEGRAGRAWARPTLTWIPPGYPGYDKDEKRWGFNVDEAKKALAESKYGSVDKLPPIKLTFSDTPRNRTRNEWLAQNWKKNLGVDLKLDPVDPTTYTALTKDIKTAPQTFILGWCADYPDPQNWLSVYWKTGAFGERIGYSNKELDKLMDQADANPIPPTAREAVRRGAEGCSSTVCRWRWRGTTSTRYLVKPWVTGYKTYPQEHLFSGSVAPWTIDIDTAKLPAKK